MKVANDQGRYFRRRHRRLGSAALQPACRVQCGAPLTGARLLAVGAPVRRLVRFPAAGARPETHVDFDGHLLDAVRRHRRRSHRSLPVVVDAAAHAAAIGND